MNADIDQMHMRFLKLTQNVTLNGRHLLELLE